MQVHLPKPLHGWRQFAGEVGIIVLGVLIALGFQEVVEELRWRADLRHAQFLSRAPPRACQAAAAAPALKVRAKADVSAHRRA